MNVKLRLVLALVLVAGAFCQAANAQTKGDAKAGKAKYELLCAACHGTGGKGDGPAAAGLNPKPADLSDRDYLSTLSDQYLFEVIKEGGSQVKKSPLMPAWRAALSDKEIASVITYLRGLPAGKASK
jgi:mono/diheme cytochrome c family protein